MTPAPPRRKIAAGAGLRDEYEHQSYWLTMTQLKTKEFQDKVAGIFDAALDVRFAGQQIWDRLEGGEWGRSEFHFELSVDCLLILEVERSQKHPHGNVAKLWPWLVEHPDKSVLLIQAYDRESLAHPKPKIPKSRRRVAAWLGRALEGMFPDRFWYHCRVVDITNRREISRIGVIQKLVDRLREKAP